MQEPNEDDYPDTPAGRAAYQQAMQRYKEYTDAQDETESHNTAGAGRELDEQTESARATAPKASVPESSTQAPAQALGPGSSGKTSGPKAGAEKPWWYDDKKDDYSSDGDANWGRSDDDISKLFPETASFDPDYAREMQKAWREGREDDFNDLKYAARERAYGGGASKPTTPPVNPALAAAARTSKVAAVPKQPGDYTAPRRDAPMGAIGPDIPGVTRTGTPGKSIQPTGSTQPSARTLEELLGGMSQSEKERWARQIMQGLTG